MPVPCPAGGNNSASQAASNVTALRRSQEVAAQNSNPSNKLSLAAQLLDGNDAPALSGLQVLAALAVKSMLMPADNNASESARSESSVGSKATIQPREACCPKVKIDKLTQHDV